jgi:hypothetical protein
MEKLNANEFNSFMTKGTLYESQPFILNCEINYALTIRYSFIYLQRILELKEIHLLRAHSDAYTIKSNH